MHSLYAMKKTREQPEANHRIQFHFTDTEMRRMDEMKQQAELRSYVQVVRNALKAYESLLNKRNRS